MQVQDLLPEISKNVKNTDPWVRKAVGVPSSLSCIVYRLQEVSLLEHELQSMLISKTLAVRVTALYLVRYGSPFDQMWPRLKRHLLTKDPFCKSLLDESYHGAILPRIPHLLNKEILAQLEHIEENTRL